jgi:Big-like domain-containing protein
MLNRKLPAIFAASLFFAATLIACGSSTPKAGGNNTGNETNIAPTLTGLAVSPLDASVPAGISARFTATGTFSDGSSQDVTNAVTWTAADATCATARTDVIGAFDTHGACSTALTAKDAATGVSASASLTVLSATLDVTVPIAIAPIDPTLLVGATLKLTVSGILSDGSSADLTFVQWQSSDPTVAFIGSDGTVLAIKAGTTTITATELTTGLSDTTTVTVTTIPGVLSYLSLSPGSVIGGGTRVVTGTVALDSPAQTDKTITLTSNNDVAATANPASIVIAAGASSGTFQVTTTAVDKRTKVTITATSSDAGDPIKTATLNVRKAH